METTNYFFVNFTPRRFLTKIFVQRLRIFNKNICSKVANHKQEEEALLNEMEVTGQAFEDMQEQNSRLIQQLREKDDANFKLMSERIKSNQVTFAVKISKHDADY